MTGKRKLARFAPSRSRQLLDCDNSNDWEGADGTQGPRDFANVQRIDQLELMARLLPERLCSPISIKGLAEDTEVGPVAIKSWLRLLEQLYFGFLLPPYHRKIQPAVKREKKWYFYQWTYAQDEAARLENHIAVQLNLACSAWNEQGFGRWELYYLRDQDRWATQIRRANLENGDALFS